MTTIYFIRHNEPDRSVRDDLLQPLTAHGRDQIREVTEYLRNKGITALYSSDCRRTLETISGFEAESGLPVHADARLREGILGCPPEENRIHTERQWKDHDYCLPEGESLRQVQTRMRECVAEILEAHPGETIAVCTHGTAMSALVNSYQPDFDWEQAKQVKWVWPWVLRFTFEENGTFIQYEETVRN